VASQPAPSEFPLVGFSAPSTAACTLPARNNLAHLPSLRTRA
jgi:hypothetical protein